MQIFVNYRTGDETFAAILLDQMMVDRFGADNVFRCARSVPLGEEFASRLWGCLAQSTVLLAVIGPHWLGIEHDGGRRLDAPDDFVRREIGYALAHGLRVIPILVGDTRLPSASELPEEIEELARRQYFRIHARSAHRDLRLLGDELAALGLSQRRAVTSGVAHTSGVLSGARVVTPGRRRRPPARESMSEVLRTR